MASDRQVVARFKEFAGVRGHNRAAVYELDPPSAIFDDSEMVVREVFVSNGVDPIDGEETAATPCVDGKSCWGDATALWHGWLDHVEALALLGVTLDAEPDWDAQPFALEWSAPTPDEIREHNRSIQASIKAMREDLERLNRELLGGARQ